MGWLVVLIILWEQTSVNPEFIPRTARICGNARAFRQSGRWVHLFEKNFQVQTVGLWNFSHIFTATQFLLAQEVSQRCHIQCPSCSLARSWSYRKGVGMELEFHLAELWWKSWQRLPVPSQNRRRNKTKLNTRIFMNFLNLISRVYPIWIRLM